MTWFIPATGELIRGKADGRSRPITGPQQPAGRTFVWKQVSPYRIEFFASDNGHLVKLADVRVWSVGRDQSYISPGLDFRTQAQTGRDRTPRGLARASSIIVIYPKRSLNCISKDRS
jgi:hypothetical protein